MSSSATMQLDESQLSAAHTVWNYMKVSHPVRKCDVIMVLGSHDSRVAERGAQLMLDGLGDWLLFSGGLGNLTEGVFEKPEADLFAEIACRMGVDKSKVLIENKSTNTGENVRFSQDLLAQQGIKVGSVLAVQKPYMERRTLATFEAQWPEMTCLCVTSPQLRLEDYCSSETGDLAHVASIMAGDFQRIKVYPRLGYQSQQVIPEEVERAWRVLVEAGFTRYLIKGEPVESTS
eukprot:scpid58062/ scgid28612/ Uncharacterized protein SCO4629